MRRLLPNRLAAPAAAVLALVLAACGGDQEGRPLPARAADALIAELERVEQGVAAGECDAVRSTNLPRVQRRIDRLPDNVDPDVRAALEEGHDRLVQLVEQQCVQEEEEPVQTETTETQPEPTETAPTETEPEEPKPEKPKPEKPKPEEPKPEEPKEKPPKADDGTGGTPVPGSDDGGDGKGSGDGGTARGENTSHKAGAPPAPSDTEPAA